MTIDEPMVLNVNFDSLGEAFGFPKDFQDPSFFQVFDRIAEYAATHDFKLSLYVIGRDLRDPEVFDRVREWARAGHEVGNHSWSHALNLGALPGDRIEEEIRSSHEIIAKCTGEPPRGFIAPNWAVSRKVVEILVDLDYLYDTSLFPSIYLYPMVGRLAWHSLGNLAVLRTILGRRDWLHPLTRPIEPHFVDRAYRRMKGPGTGRLLILPLPTLSRFSAPCWHTSGFVLGWDRLKKRLSRLLQTRRGFYYLMHPADFSDTRDFEGKYKHILERADVPLSEKLRRAEEVFALIKGSGRPVVTMRALAERYFT